MAPDDLVNYLCFLKSKAGVCKYRVRHKVGHYVWFGLQINPVQYELGETEHIIAVARDTEEFLKRSEKLSMVGELAAGIAHEIRNCQ